MKVTTILLALTLMTGATTAIGQGQEQMMPSPQQNETPDVSDKELEKFATVYMEVQTESKKMQEQAVETIEEEGMEVERFNEISNSQNNPNQESEADEAEMKKLDKINTKIEEIQTEFQNKVAGMIQKEGLTVQRYQEVYTAIQQDQELQQKFSELIQS